MAKTISDTSGDGISVPYVEFSITLPDSGGVIIGQGNFKSAGGAAITPITGFPLTAPSAPGSGLIYWIIQVNTSTGVASIKQDVNPVVADAGNVQIFSQTETPSDTNLAQDTTSASVDE